MSDVTREMAAARAAPVQEGREASPAVVDLEVVRLRALLPQLVSRCMAYAAQPAFDDALVAGVEAFYGLDVDVATAETQVLEDPTERVRFFPWLLWDRPLGGEADDGLETIGRRFAREGELAGREALLLSALNAGCVWFWQVAAARPDGALTELVELGTGRRVVVWDRALPAELTAGEVLQARLVELPEAGVALLDAVHLTLPGDVAPALAVALSPFVGPSGALDVPRVREATPDLFDLASRLAEGPADDDDPPEVITSLLVPPEAAARLLAALGPAGGSAAPLHLGAAGVDAVIEPRPGGAVRCHAVGTSAVEGLMALLISHEVRPDGLSALRGLDAAIHDAWQKASFPVWARALPRFRARTAELLEGLISRWPDTALPTLGRTPAEAARDAWGRRDVDTHLARLERGLPLPAASTVTDRLRAALAERSAS